MERNFFKILKEKLKSTKDGLAQLLSSQKNIKDILTELEELLILSDVGEECSSTLIENIYRIHKKSNGDIKKILKDEILKILSIPYSPPSYDNIAYLIVGVNGGGKTTTCAKLARRFLKNNKKVLMVAGDTFRASGDEQLSIWGERLSVPVIAGAHLSDPGSLVFEALKKLKSEDFNILIVDTAGRMHTREGLMRELEKIWKICARELGENSVESYLVLDSTIGQNAISQAREFSKFSRLKGIILTKMDGTAKGGIIIPIAHALKIPVVYVGTGENVEDLEEFSPSKFLEALLGD
ncbi:MAG: signal recognition particle-docking protein FtsY [Candidatus Aminicenantia bacterium]